MTEPRRHSHSMFWRRLVMLGVVVSLASIPLVIRLVHLTVVEGDRRRTDAMSRLVSERWLPTVRGRILDRNGRVLATDRASWDVAVEFGVLTGSWASTQAARAARREAGSNWSKMSPEERQMLRDARRPIFEARLDAMWIRISNVSGVPVEVLLERRDRIVDQTNEMAEEVWERQRLARLARLERGRSITVTAHADERRPIREQKAAHTILHDLADESAFDLMKALEQDAARDPLERLMPGVEITPSRRRLYPYESVDVDVDLSLLPTPIAQPTSTSIRVRGLTTHLVGWMRDRVYKEDVDRRPKRRPDGSVDLGHYQPGDSVGATGVERSAEDALRGARGLVRERLDTGETERVDKEFGTDVVLTIDIQLQARIAAMLDPSVGLIRVQPWHGSTPTVAVGKVLAGAAVVIEIETGDVLALVSAPMLTREDLDRPMAEDSPVLSAWVNRAVSKPYPPGSIVKPLMLASAITDGVLAPDERIQCTGHFLPNRKDIYRCWIYRPQFFMITHDDQLGESPEATQAIMASCNIFFYEIGKRLGADRVIGWYRKFGVGEGAAQIPEGLYNVFPGSVPDPKDTTWSDAVLMAIGQGPISWTPLHAAAAYATLARGGMKIDPRLRMDDSFQVEDLGLDPIGVSLALQGLWNSVHEPKGTTHHLKFVRPDGSAGEEPIFKANANVWAKSGTAQVAPITIGDEGSAEVLRYGDHAWCAALVGPKGGEPKYSICAIVEYGGSGGRVAGPIVNQVIHALQAEGYLPGAPDRGPEETHASKR